MWLFLQIVAGCFVAFLLVVATLYFIIRWKLKSWMDNLADSMLEAVAGGVPAFRIHVTKKGEGETDEEWLMDKNVAPFQAHSAEFESLGFKKVEDYDLPEIVTKMRVFVDQDGTTFGIVYAHPIANVWCDVTRRYADETSWTYGTTAYHGMDIPPWATQKFFPEQSLAEVVEKFQQEAPSGGIEVRPEEFPSYFEKAYAREMDWRIERGGTTEEEVRRIAQMNGNEVTEDQVRAVILPWRVAISEFYQSRVLKRYRKETGLSGHEWDYLQENGIVVHDRMEPEELMHLVEHGYHGATAMCEENLKDDEASEFVQWKLDLVKFVVPLRDRSPRQVFREKIENRNGNGSAQWEFKTAVTKPVEADIWVRTYEGEDGSWDEDDD